MKPALRFDGIFMQSMDDEIVVYDKHRKVAHRLNPTVAAVWRAVDGQRSTSEIAAHIGIDLSLVELSIDELGQAALLREGDVLTVSKREALQRVAAAEAIGGSIPVLTSIVAPM